MSTHSPFLDDSFHVHWSRLTPDHVESDITAALEEARDHLATLCNLDHKNLTFENTMLGLEHFQEKLTMAWGLVSHLDSVCNSEALREVHNKMLPVVAEFHSSIALNEDLWGLIKAYQQTSEAQKLTGIRKRYLEETVRDFVTSGADLPADKKKRFQEIATDLAAKTQKFSENVLDATNAWDLIIDDETKLAGLPESAKAAAKQDALSKEHGTEEDPKWRFTLQYPSLIPVMEHLENEGIRKQVWQASSDIAATGKHDNSELIREILALRQEKAEILGRDHFSDLVLESRMAKNGATALGFVNDFHTRVKEQFDADVEALQTFKAEETSTSKAPLEPWEIAYWAEKRRKKLYGFDDEALRPYFPIDRVLSGMFQITEKLFGIAIKEKESIFIEPGNDTSTDLPEVWHPEVKFYDIHDANGEHLGSFYADWHPRESKRGGAWMNYLKTGTPSGDGKPRTQHLGLICGNMTPSVGGKTALLTHNEVETVFHEFGHLLHHLLGNVEIKSFNGVNVAWDFVELPSQLMENFCWDRQSLDFFALHHETGEPIPDDLFEKMIRARNYMSASATMRQLSLGKMDLELHIHHARFEGDLDTLVDDLLKGYLTPTKTPVRPMIRRFTHLFAGPTAYASGYYSYKWAEVLDADAFTKFREAGVLSEDVGREYREHILSKGNSEEAATLFRNFMGRDPEIDALLTRSGLIS